MIEGPFEVNFENRGPLFSGHQMMRKDVRTVEVIQDRAAFDESLLEGVDEQIQETLQPSRQDFREDFNNAIFETNRSEVPH